MDFTYHNIKLYKSESLGSGSYGGVCKAKCDGLLCAVKIMHPTLFDPRDPGSASYLRKFQEECHLLSLVRHPNIVQYLGTYSDPDTRLPVLLMELCDESLTAFLQRSPGPPSYHIQLNICHDIALALVYLHSNGLIHRDLTGNNVLMITGTRAKITDFGMSKLATVNPRMTALTMCPGNVLYMSPEALDEAKSYNAKLDIFSFGVIVIQILTRQFPNPTERFRRLRNRRCSREIRVLIPDMERRQNHLQLISDTHALKLIAIQCLQKESERPSAVELCEMLCESKKTPQYTESACDDQTQTSSLVQQLQQQLQGQRMLTDDTREASECQAGSKTASDLQQSMSERMINIQQPEQRDHQAGSKTASDLQQSMSERMIKIQQPEQRERPSGAIPQLKHTPHSLPSSALGNISKMTWRKGKKAPERMKRGAVVVHGNTAYFRPWNSNRLYLYRNIRGYEQWVRQPDNPNRLFSLTVIDGLLTSVGGFCDGYTNTLLSLTEDGERKEWSEIFPPMPTPRQRAVCITTGRAVVVAGGYAGDHLNTVEVMNINSKQWSTVCPLPQKLSHFSGVACGDTLYLAGGYVGSLLSKSVFTCSVPDLVLPDPLGSKIQHTPQSGKKDSFKSNVWSEISSLPVSHTTLASFGGHLLAIGGCDDSGKTTTNVYGYNFHTGSWTIVSHMKKRRSHCFEVTLPHDRLLVVGGFKTLGEARESVEVLGQ